MTKPATGAVFDAAEDLLLAVDVTTSAGSRLPAEIAGPVAGPAERLAAAWAAQSGDAPLTELAAAVTATLAAACAAADTVLAGIRHDDRPRPARDEIPAL